MTKSNTYNELNTTQTEVDNLETITTSTNNMTDIDNSEKTVNSDSPIISYVGKGKGSNPNSKKNLMLVKTSEEARERGRKGGIKSGEVRKAKKTMRETLQDALKIELSPEKLEELGAEVGLMNGDTTVLSAIIASTIREAINGDTKAIQFVRDSIGEKPIDEMHTVNETITKEDTDMMKDLRDSLISKVM